MQPLSGGGPWRRRQLVEAEKRPEDGLLGNAPGERSGTVFGQRFCPIFGPIFGPRPGWEEAGLPNAGVAGGWPMVRDGLDWAIYPGPAPLENDSLEND